MEVESKAHQFLNSLDLSKIQCTAKYNCSICIIVKDEGPYIKEWLDYHKKIGFQHFYIYDNNNNPEDLKAIENRKDCTIIKFPGIAKQVSAYQHFATHFSHQTKWIAFIDGDEFIVPSKHNNINDFIAEYGHLKSIAINWKLFTSNNHIKKPKGLVTANYTQSAFNNHVKLILNTKLLRVCKINHMHNVIMYAKTLDGKIIESHFNEKDFNNIIRINHYFTKSKDEFAKKIERGRATGAIKRTWQTFENHNNFKTKTDTLIIDKYFNDEINNL